MIPRCSSCSKFACKKFVSAIKKLTNIPSVIAIETTVPVKSKANFFPCKLLSTPTVLKLVAGPVNKKAMPAPGESPFARSTATIGVAPEAQT